MSLPNRNHSVTPDHQSHNVLSYVPERTYTNQDMITTLDDDVLSRVLESRTQFYVESGCNDATSASRYAALARRMATEATAYARSALESYETARKQTHWLGISSFPHADAASERLLLDRNRTYPTSRQGEVVTILSLLNPPCNQVRHADFIVS